MTLTKHQKDLIVSALKTVCGGDDVQGLVKDLEAKWDTKTETIDGMVLSMGETVLEGLVLAHDDGCGNKTGVQILKEMNEAKTW